MKTLLVLDNTGAVGTQHFEGVAGIHVLQYDGIALAWLHLGQGDTLHDACFVGISQAVATKGIRRYAVLHLQYDSCVGLCDIHIILFSQRAVLPLGVGWFYLCDVDGVHQLAQHVVRCLGREVGLSDAMPTDTPLAKALLAHLRAIVLQTEIDIAADEVGLLPFTDMIAHIVDATGIASRKGGFA